MKRCSQCDFIYEDDQHLCDMDGHELVYEPTLQALQIRATEPVTRPLKSGTRRQALAAAVAVLIATVLSVGYSGFTSDYAPQNTKAPSTKLTPVQQFAPDQPPPTPDQPATMPDQPPDTPDQPPATPVVDPTPSPSHSPRLEKSRVSPTVASPVARSSPSLRSPAPRGETARSQPQRANDKKESGIGGFLRKTGKVLKRPFKF